MLRLAFFVFFCAIISHCGIVSGHCVGASVFMASSGAPVHICDPLSLSVHYIY